MSKSSASERCQGRVAGGAAREELRVDLLAGEERRVGRQIAANGCCSSLRSHPRKTAAALHSPSAVEPLRRAARCQVPGQRRQQHDCVITVSSAPRNRQGLFFYGIDDNGFTPSP
jgi:hypothetical protein